MDLPAAQRLALINGATGIDDPKRLKRQAVKGLTKLLDVDSMLQAVVPVVDGSLRFVRLLAFEGEFRIGLGRIIVVPDNSALVKVFWLEPRGLRKYVLPTLCATLCHGGGQGHHAGSSPERRHLIFPRHLPITPLIPYSTNPSPHQTSRG